MTISTHLVAILIGLIYPVYFLLTYKKTGKRIKNDSSYRLVDYKLTIFIFWILTLLVLVNMLIDKSLYLNFYPTFNTIGIILAVLISVFIGIQIFTSKVSTIEKAKSIEKKMQDVYHFLPKSKREFKWFNLLSISAGICEEIIFRLFLFSYLLEITNLIVAFVLTNIVFAITHLVSGIKNIIGAFILGIIFTTIFYLTENIWLAIVLHIAIDISAGTLGYYSFKYKNEYQPKEVNV